MKRFKYWLKNKLIEFLGIDKIVNLLDKHIDNNESIFKELKNLIYNLNYNTKKELKNDISHFQGSVNALHNTVENIVHIGTDVHRENTGHSWAVVCVEGKINIIKFVDLDRKDAREIFDFLKHLLYT
jgi:hypothetical protein